MDITIEFGPDFLGDGDKLSLIDPRTGQNIIADVIGNAGEMGKFKFDEKTNTFVCDINTHVFWYSFCKARQPLEDLLNEVRKEHGLDLVEEFAEKHMDPNDFTVEAQRAAFAKLSELNSCLA